MGVSESGGMTSQLQASTFYGLLKILATMAAGSHVVAEALMEVRGDIGEKEKEGFYCGLEGGSG